MGCQRNTREKRGSRCTNVGIGGDQLLLCLADVRTLHEQIGGEARRYGLDDWRCVQVTASQGGADVFGQGLPQQQSQRIFIQCPLALLLGQRGPRSLRQRFGLPVVELGCGTRIQPQFGQANRLFAGSQSASRQFQQFLVGQQVQPPVGDGADQADLGRIAAFFGSQILRKRLFLQAGHPAEEVQFPRSHSQPNAEVVGDVACAGRRCARGVGRQSHGWVLRSTTYLELGSRLLYVEACNAQVAVVVQRQLNQLLQPWFGKVGTP